MRVALTKLLAQSVLSLAVLSLPALAESFVVECASNAPGPEAGSMFCNQGKMIEFTPTADMFLKPRTQRAQDYISGRFG